MDKKDKIIQKLRQKLETKDRDLDAERKRNAVLAKDLEYENSLWTSEATQDRSARSPELLNKLESLDNIIKNDKDLHTKTGMNKERFSYILEMLKAAIVKDKSCPAFHDWDYDTAGNRCKLYVRHALLLYLMYEREDTSQNSLAIDFHINQSTVSRYIQRVEKKLPDLLPTADEISKRICKADSKRKVKQLIPGDNGGTLIVDGFATEVQRPTKNGTRRRMYSGKRKRFSLNTILYANVNRVIIGLGATVQGSMHDIMAMRLRAPKLGRWLKSMKNSKTPKQDRINIDADAGFQGIQQDYPGANVKTPHKKSKCTKLTKAEKKANHDLARERVAVENTICMVKKYNRMCSPYENTLVDYSNTDEYEATIRAYRDELNVITGLENLNTTWDDIMAGRGPIAQIMKEKRAKLGLT